MGRRPHLDHIVQLVEKMRGGPAAGLDYRDDLAFALRLDVLRLTRLELQLYLFLYDRLAERVEDLAIIRHLYGRGIGRAPQAVRKRYRDRLRQLQRALNAKLDREGREFVYRPMPSVLRLVDGIDLEADRRGDTYLQKHAPRGYRGRRTPAMLREIAFARQASVHSPYAPQRRDAADTLKRLDGFRPPTVAEAVEAILEAPRSEFGGRTVVPSVALQSYLKRLGCRPSTIRNACRKLGVTHQRRGFGADGEWYVRLPSK